MARLIAISYAGVTIGLSGDASYHLTDKYRVSQTYEEFGITFQVLVQNATRATFLTAEAALLAAFRKPDQDLSVQLGGSNRHVFTQAGNTGMNARAAARKVGGDEDTANSALYECTVTVKLPADLTGKSGRQSASEELTYTPSGRRMLILSGTYTALSTNSATAQYTAAANTYCDAVISDLSLTGLVEKKDERWSRDHNNKTLTFVRTYEEIVYQQGAGTTDVTAIKGAKILIARAELSADASPEYGGAAPAVALRVEYDTWVDKAVTTDLTSLWEGTIRNTILAAATTAAGGVAPIVVREEPRFDFTDNRVSATVDLIAAASGILFARVEYEDDVSTGRIFVPVWNGDPYARDEYQGPASHVRRMSTFLVMLRGNKPGTPTPPDGSGFLPSAGTFHEVRALRRVNHFNRGLIGGGQLGLVAVTLEQVFVRAEIASAGSPAGSSGGTRERIREVDPDADLGA